MIKYNMWQCPRCKHFFAFGQKTKYCDHYQALLTDDGCSLTCPPEPCDNEDRGKMLKSKRDKIYNELRAGK